MSAVKVGGLERCLHGCTNVAEGAHLYGKGPGLLSCTRCALPQILHVCQRSSQLILQILNLIRHMSAVYSGCVEGVCPNAANCHSQAVLTLMCRGRWSLAEFQRTHGVPQMNKSGAICMKCSSPCRLRTSSLFACSSDSPVSAVLSGRPSMLALLESPGISVVADSCMTSVLVSLHAVVSQVTCQKALIQLAAVSWLPHYHQT